MKIGQNNTHTEQSNSLRLEANKGVTRRYPVIWGPLNQEDVWGESEISIYIHVPFCKKKCNYCGFNSYAANPALTKQYVASQIKEIELYKGIGDLFNSRKIDAIYFGGGTPSALSADDLARILEAVKTCFNVSPSPEVTLEASPETLNSKNLREFKSLDFTRLSIGLQSVDNRILKMLGRSHNYEDALRTVETARMIGWDDVGLDLIYGIPTQTLSNWEDTVNQTIRCGLEHISIHQLAVIPFTPLFKQLKDRLIPPLPDKEMIMRQYTAAINLLRKNGYAQYTFADFALKGKKCKYLSWIWSTNEYLGLGPGALSYVNGFTYTTYNDLDGYFDSIKNGVLPIEAGASVPLKEKMARAMVLGFNNLEIPRSEFVDAFGYELDEVFNDKLEELENKGLVSPDTQKIKVTPEGMHYLNSISKYFFTPENKEGSQLSMENLMNRKKMHPVSGCHRSM